MSVSLDVTGKMRIVCLLRSLEVGGVERQLTGLAVLLKEAGHDVEIVTYIPRDFFSNYLKENGIPATYIPKRLGPFTLARDIAAHLKEQGTQLVIAFASSASSKACLAKFIFRDFKLIVSERNHIKRFYPNDWFRFLLYSKADWIISNSYAQHDHVTSFVPAFRKKASAIINFVDVDKFVPAPKKGRDGVVRIAVVARVSRRKNLHGLIKAAGILKTRGLQFKIEWYGATRQSRFWKKCMALISKLGLDDVFEIKDALQDVRAVYHNADVFCLPSFYEGTPNAVCEALSCGLPVVCSDVSDNALYVQKGVNGWLFDPTDLDDMVNVLEEVITKGRDKFEEYGHAGREIAIRKLSMDRFRKEYLSLIEQLAESDA